MFADKCCFFVIRTYSEGVVFTRWTDRDGVADGQTDCVIHIFIYLIQTFVEWHVLDISHHIQLISFIFNQEGFCESVVLGKRLPPDHLTMLCCHVAYLEKVFFVNRSGVVNSVFILLL